MPAAGRFNNVLVIGASRGIGLELCRVAVARGAQVIATGRSAPSSPAADVRSIAMDVTDAGSIQNAAAELADLPGIDLLIYAAGVLHADGMQPEKRIEDIDPEALATSFAVNSIGPLLVAKAFWRTLRKAERPVLMNISAKVGSIGDNGIGGWYGYRASKAAQNQATRTLAIEMSRRAPNLVCFAAHPGTTRTALSEPFLRNVPETRLADPSTTAARLYALAENSGPAQHGCFLHWDGSTIPW